MGKRSANWRINYKDRKMLKKTLSALALVTAFSAAADPILLPGGVVVNDPATPNTSNGLGNVNSAFEFLQWFEVTNPNDSSQSAIVGLDEVGNVTYDQLFGSGSLDTFDFDDLTLFGAGELSLGNDSGDLNCGSCELTLSFGGLAVDFDNGGFNLDDSFINVYLSDLSSNFELSDMFANLDNGAAPDLAQLGYLTDGTLWLSGTFDQLIYNPDGGPFELPYRGLASGQLKAAIQVEGTSAGTGIANENVLNDSLSSFGDFFNFDTFDALAFSLSSSFIDGGASTQINTIARANEGNFSTNMVSAPGSLAILGAGLLALARICRSKK